MIHTDYEFVTLDVKHFQAVGDGIHDDTAAIQAAIMACPAQSRVWIPKGTYKVSSLFLKRNMAIQWRFSLPAPARLPKNDSGTSWYDPEL